MIHQEDAVAFLNALEPESVDLIITDPAYESLEKHRSHGTTTRLLKKWFKIFPNTRYEEFFAACWRVLKPNAHLYVFSDQDTMHIIRPIGIAARFTYWKFLVWDKETIGMGYHWRYQHELISFFEKGKRKLNDLGMGDVITARRLQGKDLYPTEKPPEAIEPLVLNSSDPGQLVCDPFCGSGVVLAVALHHGRRVIGSDISTDAVTRARAKLEAVGS